MSTFYALVDVSLIFQDNFFFLIVPIVFICFFFLSHLQKLWIPKFSKITKWRRCPKIDFYVAWMRIIFVTDINRLKTVMQIIVLLLFDRMSYRLQLRVCLINTKLHMDNKKKKVKKKFFYLKFISSKGSKNKNN